MLEVVNGPSVASHDEPGFTDAFFVQPSDVPAIMAAYPVEQLELLGVEGLTSQSEKAVTGISQEVTDAWIKLAIGTASTTAALYGSDHILYIGRKNHSGS